MPTTVESIDAMAEPRIVATSTHRPGALADARPSRGELTAGSGPLSAAPCTPPPARGLGGCAGLDPAAEDVDTFGGPCSVAWHCAGLDPAEDRVGVGRDVVEGPEVEGETHRIAVTLAKKRLDVLLEMH